MKHTLLHTLIDTVKHTLKHTLERTEKLAVKHAVKHTLEHTLEHAEKHTEKQAVKHTLIHSIKLRTGSIVPVILPNILFIFLFFVLLSAPAQARTAEGHFSFYQAVPLPYLVGMFAALVISAFMYREKHVSTVITLVSTIVVTGLLSFPLFGRFWGPWSFSLPVWVLVMFFLNLTYLWEKEPAYKRVGTGVVLWVIASVFIVYAATLGSLDSAVLTSFTGCVSNERTLTTTLEMYADRHKGLYPKALAEVVPNYTKRLPGCFYGRHSAKAKEHYKQLYGVNLGDYKYEVSKTRKRYTIYCDGHNHLDAPAGYPRFSSETGLIPRPGEEGKY